MPVPSVSANLQRSTWSSAFPGLTDRSIRREESTADNQLAKPGRRVTLTRRWGPIALSQLANNAENHANVQSTVVACRSLCF